MVNNIAISVESLTKQYDLGVIGTGTLSRDLNRWWARVRKQPDPYTRIGQKDQFEEIGGSILALDDISFTVNQGEALGIIGKNGAGKSTLLKILSRVTAPTSGVVKVKGRIGSLLEVGTGFHPELTGRENVYLNGAILGMRKEEVTRKFDEIVDFSGVEKFIDTPVKRYSSGMYVRLAFAVAAHLDPEILIVDEVLAVGDAEFQKKCLGKMGDVAGEGRTVLFVSHNMGSILQLCKSGILLSNGKLDYLGEVSSCINSYLRASVSSTKIINQGILKTDDINIHSVNVNNQDSRELELLPSTKSLLLNIIGETRKNMNLSLEAKLFDSNGSPLAYFCPANFDEHYDINKDKYLGIFELKGEINLPTLTKGDYYLDIYLTEPNSRGLWDCRNGLHIRANSIPMRTAQAALEYRKGFGSIILGGDFSINLIEGN